ncbi:ABC transporter ATP-binding protein [filamentous cyanobacterium CCP3]|nr:ABC transporter ATP-binding protein [filamentous cyanobacterium CCP3]
MSDTVIRVENLGKKYIIGHQQQERYTALRDVLANKARGITQIFNPKSKIQNPKLEEFWALKDVSFEVKQGDRIGIIGRNGAGKSTLLKILSRITEPTEGRISIKGRVASLLEVGTGFHPELTGRENVYLNGAILGMSKVEIHRKFDEIVAFAEVEKFLDTPVKRYSSGMYVRLAFAVAAHLEPEILVVDEVLAVGDAAFQKKCLGKMEDVAEREGRTVLFVSHNMAAIRKLCLSSILLRDGKLFSLGKTFQCITLYEDELTINGSSIWTRQEPEEKIAQRLAITKIEAKLRGEQPHLQLYLDVSLISVSSHKAAFIAIDILDSSGTTIMQAIPSSNGYIRADKRKYHSLKVIISLPPLIPDQYLISAWVGSHNSETIDWVKHAVTFEVFESPIPGRSYPHSKTHGHIIPHSSYSFQ